MSFLVTTCTFRSLGHLHTALVSRIFQDVFSCYKLQLNKIVTSKDIYLEKFVKPKQDELECAAWLPETREPEKNPVKAGYRAWVV